MKEEDLNEEYFYEEHNRLGLFQIYNLKSLYIYFKF